MLTLCRYEMKKIWGQKLSLFLVFVLLLANVGLIYIGQERQPIPGNAYKAFDRDISQMTEFEKGQFITEYCSMVKGVGIVEEVNTYKAIGTKKTLSLAEDLEKKNQKTYKKYFKAWKQDKYLKYTHSLEQETAFAQDISDRWKSEGDYRGYIEKIRNTGLESSGISIFRKDNNQYASKNISATMTKYHNMEDTRICFASLKWLDGVLSFAPTDIIILMGLFIIIGQLVYEEKKNGILHVLKSTLRGKNPLIASKIITLVISMTIVASIVYGSSLFYWFFNTGLNGWGSSLQSAFEYIGSTSHITVGGFFLVTILTKILGYVNIGLILLLIAVLVNNFIWVVGGGVALIGLNLLPYYLIGVNDKGNLLHFVNGWSAIRSEKIWGGYSNLNIFGYPLEARWLILMWLLMMAALVVINSVVFIKTRNLSIKHFYIKFGRTKSKASKVLSNEFYKVGWMNKGFVIIFCFLILMAYLGVNQDNYMTPNEQTYKSKMLELEGPITKEKSKAILEEKNWYEGLFQKMETIKKQVNAGKISPAKGNALTEIYQQKTAFYPAFERVYERYQYVAEKPGTAFVYEKGYLSLLSINDITKRDLLLLLIAIILATAGVFAMEGEKGMKGLIHSMPYGRNKTVRSKIIASSLITLVAIMGWVVKNFIIAIETFGLQGMGYSASSIPELGFLPGWVSLGMTLVTYCLVQLLGIGLVEDGILWLSRTTGNSVNTMIISIGLTVLPLTLWMILG